MKDDSESPASEPTSTKKKSKKSRVKKSPQREAPSSAPASAPTKAGSASASAPTKAGAGGGSSALLVGALALAVGGGGGWFLRDARARDTVSATPDLVGSAAPVGSAGVCGSWASTICQEVGASSESCEQAKAASTLLPEDACQSALKDVPATVARAKSVRSVCDQLMERLCKEIGEDTDTCKMVKEQTPKFPVSRCKELLEGIDEVVGELKQQEKLKQPLSPELATKIAANDAPSFGPKDAKVTVVEFSDFECPYCARAAETFDTLKERYGDRVRFVFRQFPLSFHKKAQLAAEASLAAHAQGKFWEFHDKVFQNQESIERENLEKYAEEVGLDLAKFKKALDDKTYADAVKADMTLAGELPVNGTPTVFVGGKRVEAPSVEEISKEIDTQLAAGG